MSVKSEEDSFRKFLRLEKYLCKANFVVNKLVKAETTLNRSACEGVPCCSGTIPPF